MKQASRMTFTVNLCTDMPKCLLENVTNRRHKVQTNSDILKWQDSNLRFRWSFIFLVTFSPAKIKKKSETNTMKAAGMM